MRGESSGMINLENKIELWVPIIPVAKARPRMGKHGVYTPQKTVSFEQSIRFAFIQSKQKILPEMPTLVAIEFYLPRPKKHKFYFPISRPDVDNLLKGVIDALNGFAWKDDNQITTLIGKKNYAEKDPGVHLIAHSII